MPGLESPSFLKREKNVIDVVIMQPEDIMPHAILKYFAKLLWHMKQTCGIHAKT